VQEEIVSSVSNTGDVSGAPHSRLKREVLSSLEVGAQSVAGMAPSAAMAVNVLLVYLAGAHGGTWLSTVIALVIMSLVAYAIVVFAGRVTSAGWFYTWVSEGLGDGAGHAAGWGLLLGYICTGMATVIGFALYGSSLISDLGGPNGGLPVEVPLMVVCAGAAIAVSVADIKLSARTALTLEAVSVSIIVALCIAAYVHHGGVIDKAQLTLSGAHFGGIIEGTVLAIFSFVGFESSASLGVEARNPLRSVRRAVMWSCIGVGLFYVIVSYTQILGFAGAHPGFAASTAPLPGLANLTGLHSLVPLIDAGVTVSMFACTLACVNAGSRMLFTVAADGLAPRPLQRTHPRHATPARAILTIVAPMIGVPLLFVILGHPLLAVDGWMGTLATFGFMLAYALVAVAAPAFLRREGTANRTAWITGGAAAASMAFVFWVNWLPQVPHNTLFSPLAFPYTILPYVFFGWTAVGLGSYLLLGRQAAVGRGEQFTVRAVPAAQAVPAGQAVPD
jgi:amino acid transporter